MNVRNVVVTSQETQYGVKYKFIPDSKSLGTKFKKDAMKIRAALEKVPMNEIQMFASTNEITVEGFKLTPEDVSVTRYFDGENSKYHAHFTNQVLVILDVTLDQSLIHEGLAREFVNRVQRLRKKAALSPIDEVRYLYKITTDVENQLDGMFETQNETLFKYLKQEVEAYVEVEFLLEEEQDINGSKFILALARK